MKNLIKKAVVLAAVFVLAVAGYFSLSLFRQEEEHAMYTSIEDANLPVAYIEQFGRKMNRLNGFLSDVPSCAGRGDLSVLPADRNLTVVFDDVHTKVNGIQYEIRSLEGDRLVERTVLEEWTAREGELKAELPIQNLLTENQEYRLTLAIATEEHPAVYYYTRIVWSPDSHAEEMLQLAVDFSEKTFDYNAAQDLTTYLETDPNTDNSTLGRISLKNSFDMLTWRGLDMQKLGESSMHLRELQGSTGTVEIDYVAVSAGEDGASEYFDVTEAFTMRWTAQRIYMMDYERRVNQIFSGDNEQYSDKRIMLGISDEEELQAVSSPDEKYRAFVANRALWFYDVAEGESTKVFAFRKSEDDLRTSEQSHGVKILSVSEEGDIDFLVYGYMSRGNHEGTTGVAVYRYERDGNSLTERLYLPSEQDYESLREEIGTLSYLSEEGVLYLRMDHAVYAVELAGKEYMVVADGLTEANFAVSTDGSRIAWQDGDEIYGSRKLNVMDLSHGKKDEIVPAENLVIRLVGFVGTDLVYGLAASGEEFKSGGRVTGIPLSAIEIVGTDMQLETRYEKPGIYLDEVEIRESRVHISRVKKDGNTYLPVEEDTLVCNEAVLCDPLDGIGYLADSVFGRKYFVQLDESVSRSRNIRTHVPKKVVAEENNVMLLRTDREPEHRSYQAYSRGRLQGSFVTFADAVTAANAGMGLVTDETGNVLWSRIDRNTTKTVRDLPEKIQEIKGYLSDLASGMEISEDGMRLFDARGLTLNQVLYFVSEGWPVAAYPGDGTWGLIYGYDTFNISWCPNPEAEELITEKIGLNDAAAFFEAAGETDFVCFLPSETP